MSAIDDRMADALMAVGDKLYDTDRATAKKAYSERISSAVACTLAGELEARGLRGVMPSSSKTTGRTGAERRMAGGLGAKKVDVTWATEEGGLILGISIKTINFRDRTTKNFQKNLTNRRGDMLFEAVTLHRRFPYAVLGGLFFLDKGASVDQTNRRRSTFQNAHDRFHLFSGRDDPGAREEQYERIYLVLLDASSNHAEFNAYRVGEPQFRVDLDEIVDELLTIVAHRNPDFYEYQNGKLASSAR